MIKIDLITGFLGAGKTSFIKKYADYLLKKGERIGIIESDHGAINVDLLLLQELMDRGCDLEMIIGGNSQADHQRRFRSKLISMAMLGYDRIIVEPSGIYDTDEFFDVLHEEPLDCWYEIGNVITLLDARLTFPLSDASSYLLVSQCADAGAIVLSRSQLASPEEISQTLSSLESCLQTFQCKKDISSLLFDKDWDLFSKEDWEKLAGCGISYADHIKMPLCEEKDYDSLFFMGEQYPRLFLPAGPSDTEAARSRDLKEISYYTEVSDRIKKATEAIFTDPSCGNVIRIKGFLSLPDESYLQLNASAKDFSLEKAARGQDLLIVIGENLDKEKILTQLQTLTADH